MTPESQSLEFLPTPLSLSLGIGFVLLVAVLSFIGWKRSGWKPLIGWLEILRVIIAIAIAVTLLQPEWLETFKPDRMPTLAVVYDDSGSMQTRDVFDPEKPAAEPRSRAEAAEPLTKPEAWAALTERMDVVFEPFSSAEDPPEEATDLNGALAKLPEEHPQLAAVVLLSDGDWNLGGPPAAAATRLRMRSLPVFAVTTGSPVALPDVVLTSFEVPVFAVAGKPLRVPFSITSNLPREETVMLEMTAGSGEVVTKDVTIPAMGVLDDSVVWRPNRPGPAKLKLVMPKTGDETNVENNAIEAELDVRKEQLRVLVVESFPRWEYRYLRNALERDPGVEVNCLLLHPDLDKPGTGRGYLDAFPKDEELTEYDVVFLGDVGIGSKQLSDDQAESLRKLVRDQASGLVFLPGFRGFQSSLLSTPLGELMPVVWDPGQPRGWGTPLPGKFVLTEAGTRSLLTKLEDSDEASARTWSTLPGFHWYAPALRAKVGTEVLATHGTESTRFGRVPLIVTRTYGAGKILFMGTDGAWRWRKGVEDKYHYRFWGQVVRWMAYQRNMASGEKMRLFYSPDRPQTNESLNLNANVMSMTGEPLRDGTVIAEIAAPSGKVNTVRLTSAGEEAWGLFTGLITPTEPGPHRIRISCAESGAPLETTIPIQGTAREKRGAPARPDVLDEIAQLTRGQLLDSTDVAAVVAAVAALPEIPPEQRRLQIWAHPGWVGVILLMLGVFWVGRKAAGTF